MADCKRLELLLRALCLSSKLTWKVNKVSITKRESGSAIVFEVPNGVAVGFYSQGVCYVNPVCPSGIKSSISTLVPEDAVLEESLTQVEFLELLAKKTK